MKKFAVAVVFVLSLFAMAAAAEEFTGYIADAACAAKGKATSDGHAGCAQGCIKKGQAAVLATTDGKVYKLSDQEKAKEHAGHKVTVVGKLSGDTITVESIKM